MKLYTTLEQQLKKEPNFVTDNGELKKWVVLNKAQNFNEELIGLLLDNADLREKFFVNVKGTLVFNQNLFVQFLEQKNYLNDSYTQYKNKVGLTIDGKYLKQRNEVALVWPFKDCILEGGQSREEDKREEIFFNEILAQDEITQLLEPKVLTNAKRIDKDGEKPLDQFKRNENGTITDNLIIKGNNLLALHTLKEEFAGKVKLIYIDPPYNTGNDGFNYNDSFNHSSWLTFMKNRLMIAKELLRDDGVIFITCDDNEEAYLKVLLDEIFGRDNFVANFIWKHRKSSQNDIDVSLSHNYNFCYAKNREIFRLIPLEANVEKFSNPDNDPRGAWVADPFDAPNIRENLTYEITNPNTGEVYLPPKGRCWRFSKEKFEEALKDNRIIYGKKGTSRPQYKRFLFEAESKGENPFTVWDDIDTATNATKELMKLFDEKIFSTPKPETLLERILKISTHKNDIVLDFFLGSGTTASTAHKMNRQYIGIEQMDYVETVAVERLKKVIEGEQGGISKSVDWQGGGDFVYLELKKYNQIFIEQIEEAKDTKALLQIWEQMKAKSFLNYNVDIKKQEEHIEEFKTLTLKEQKQHLCEILDKNQLYVNLSSLEDADFACSDDEKKVTKDFYQIKK
jgi:adenine-specific DNA-methyltransferase